MLVPARYALLAASAVILVFGLLTGDPFMGSR